MKKQLHVFALVSVICGASVSAANAADGTIQFNGEIIDAACTVSPSSANQTVNLGQISDKAFTGAGDTAGATAFQIDLTSCPATVSSASVKFDGTPYQGDNSALELTQGAGVATGVGIQIRNADNSVLPLFTQSQSTTLSQTGTNTLKFNAAYVAKAAAVTAGPANATATFSVVYN
jgi:major type 1 subunit fimbrin (pilin)